MTTQAVTDIKELVGEMPARGCEWQDCECDAQARWIARAHQWFDSSSSCRSVVLCLCDQHKDFIAAMARSGARESAVGLRIRVCPSCNTDFTQVGNLFGPVMPL